MSAYGKSTQKIPVYIQIKRANFERTFLSLVDHFTGSELINSTANKEQE